MSKAPLIDFCMESLQKMEAHEYLRSEFVKKFVSEQKRVIAKINEDRLNYKMALMRISDKGCDILKRQSIAQDTLDKANIAPNIMEKS